MYFFYGLQSLPADWLTISIFIMFFGSLNILGLYMIGRYILHVWKDGKKGSGYFIKEKNF